MLVDKGVLEESKEVEEYTQRDISEVVDEDIDELRIKPSLSQSMSTGEVKARKRKEGRGKGVMKEKTRKKLGFAEKENFEQIDDEGEFSGGLMGALASPNSTEPTPSASKKERLSKKSKKRLAK